MSAQSQSNSSINLTDTQLSNLRALQELFNQADALIKEVEDFIGEAGIPALNELRYTGYHLSHAILLDERKLCDAQIASAINHCKRACYEAAEAGIVVALIKFDEFRTDYKHVVVSNVLPNWQEIQRDFFQSQRDINAGRSKGDEDRSSDYDLRMTAFRSLRNHCENTDCARDDLNATKRKDTQTGQLTIAGLIITIIGILVATYFNITKSQEKLLAQTPTAENTEKSP